MIDKPVKVSPFRFRKARCRVRLIHGSEQNLKHATGSTGGWDELHGLASQGGLGIDFSKSLKVAFLENSDPVTFGTGSLQMTIGKSLSEGLDLEFHLLQSDPPSPDLFDISLIKWI